MKENETKETPESKETTKPAEEIQPTEAVTTDRKRTSRKAVISTTIAAVAICFVAGLAGAKAYNSLVLQNGLTGHQTVADDGNKPVTQEETDIANVVEKVSPSVVSIVTTSKTISPYYGAQEEDSAGTGIIISKDG